MGKTVVPSRRALTSSSLEEKKGPVQKQASKGPDFDVFSVLSFAARAFNDDDTEPTTRTFSFLGGLI
jgi:hypothetical protein